MSEASKPETMQTLGQKLADESQGALKAPSKNELEDIKHHIAPFANKFIATFLKDGTVKIGYAIEYTPEESKFIDGFVTSINSLATLHNLLTKILTAFQQQQQQLIQQAQAKVNPQFLETLKGMQEANKSE